MWLKGMLVLLGLALIGALSWSYLNKEDFLIFQGPVASISTDIPKTAKTESSSTPATRPIADKELNKFYQIKLGRVYFTPYIGLTPGTSIEVVGADVDTFQVLNSDIDDSYYGTPYGSDAHAVFERDVRIEGADPVTFRFNFDNDWYHLFSADSTHVFYLASTTSFDSQSFRVIDGGSWKDCGHQPYVVDKNGVYTINRDGNTLKIEGADPATFKVPEVQCDSG